MRINRNSYRALTSRGLLLSQQTSGAAMSDIILSSFALALFVATVGYAYICERL
jgi:hypothetical protein